MVIAWPARIAPGRTSDQVAISMDWLPTLLAAAGTAPNQAAHPIPLCLYPWPRSRDDCHIVLDSFDSPAPWMTFAQRATSP